MREFLREAEKSVSYYKSHCEQLPVRNNNPSQITVFFLAHLEYANALIVLGHLQEKNNDFFNATRSYYLADLLIEQYELTDYLEDVHGRLFSGARTVKHDVEVELSHDAKAEQDVAVLNIKAIQHMSGIGVPHNFAMAMAYWNLAYRKGSAEAALYLHHCYNDENNVIPAPEWAQQLLINAASLGDARAQTQLANEEFRRSYCKAYSRSHKRSDLTKLLAHAKEGCKCCSNAAAAHEQGYEIICGSAESALQGSPMNVEARLIQLFKSVPKRITPEKNREIQALVLHMLSIKSLLNNRQKSMVYFFVSVFYLVNGQKNSALIFYQRYNELGCKLPQKIGRDMQIMLYNYMVTRFFEGKCSPLYSAAALECARTVTEINHGDKTSLRNCYTIINSKNPVALKFSDEQIAKIRLDISRYRIPEAEALLIYLHRSNCAPASYHYYMWRLELDTTINEALEYFILDPVRFMRYLTQDEDMNGEERTTLVIKLIDRLERISLSNNIYNYNLPRVLCSPSCKRIKAMMGSGSGDFDNPLVEAQLALAEYLVDKLKKAENDDSAIFISKITVVLALIKIPGRYQPRVASLKKLSGIKSESLMQPLVIPQIEADKVASAATWSANNGLGNPNTHFRVSPPRGNSVNNGCALNSTQPLIYESTIVV